jgi:hypothetical protein
MKYIGAVILLFAMYGCSAVDYQLTSFRLKSESADSKAYTYVAFADAVYPLHSVNAEKQRMEWLEKWLQQNNISTNTFKIISRETYIKNKGLLGETYDIYYTVEVPTKK